MNKQTLIKTAAALALFGATQAAYSAHDPSPCDTGQVGDGNSCLYLTISGNTYNAATGDRAITVGAGSTLTIGLWQDFRSEETSGGGLDLNYEDAAFVNGSVSFTYDPAFPDDFGNDVGEENATFTAYENFGWGSFSGYGGPDEAAAGRDPGFILVGTFTLTLEAGFFGTTNLFLTEVQSNPQNAPFTQSGGAPNMPGLFDLQVTTVPVPAAAWLMISGLGALVGFGRRKAAAA